MYVEVTMPEGLESQKNLTSYAFYHHDVHVQL